MFEEKVMTGDERGGAWINIMRENLENTLRTQCVDL